MFKRLSTTAQDGFSRVLFGKEAATPIEDFYATEANLIDGTKTSMGEYKFSLVELWDKYHERGLEILAFPCNQFGAQEPKSHEEILQFASKYKGADGKGANEKFIFFEKSDVNGKKTNQVFSYLKKCLAWEDGTKDVRWNFGKFLVSGEGLPYKRFGSKDAPRIMEDDIVELLDRLRSGRGSSVEAPSSNATKLQQLAEEQPTGDDNCVTLDCPSKKSVEEGKEEKEEKEEEQTETKEDEEGKE
ncbi:hypothetical protein TrVE_jg11835 [Triparma verrucosa]|uniref:Glutathione peroxidase n=1 Tax=Triparma verrucosa TaxID=1606542 RepID=A0A9W7B6D0_9STRA|nr:hypothetical protein TrVE_jg11835 [Triparma verrucosa]